MSINTINSVFEHSKSKGVARLVLIAIADHQGEIGAWPSIKTLARMVNASERTVQREIQNLVALGELEVYQQQAPTSGRYRANLYWVKLPGVTNQDLGVTNEVLGVTNQDLGVTSIGALTINRTITKTIKEPKGKKEKVIAHFLPEDFEPTDENWKLMKEHFPWVDLKKQTHAFTDYWLSAPPSKAKKTDWQATWRNWIRRAADYNKPPETEKRTRYKFTMEEE